MHAHLAILVMALPQSRVAFGPISQGTIDEAARFDWQQSTIHNPGLCLTPSRHPGE